MKLRVRSMASKDTMKIEVPSDCDLPQLKEVISGLIGADSSSIIVSLNRRDDLFGSPEETLRSLGVSSGDLLFYTTDSSVLVPKTVTIGAEPSTASQHAASLDVGKIDCGNSEGVGEVKAVEEWKEARIEESERERTGFGDEEMADVKVNETLDYEYTEPLTDENMDVEFSQDVISKRQSMPYFLKNVFKDGLGGALSGHNLLVAAVHAILVESGFVRLDPSTSAPVHGFQFLDGRLSPAMTLSLRYTLDELLKSVASEVVILKLHKLGSNLVVYGSLRGNKNGCYSVKLDESHYAPKMDILVQKCSESSESVEDGGGSEDMFLNVLHRGDVFKFYKEVKDKLALPLLIDICDKAELPQPPCLMLLPTELKLKIFELVSGVDLVNLACQCSEFRYLTSDNTLWKKKFVEEFGNNQGSNSTDWKRKFVSFWRMTKSRKMAKERERASDHMDVFNRYDRLHVPRWRPSPFGTPFIIGGDYDLYPFGNSGPSTAPFGGSSIRQPPFPHPFFRQARRFSPNCNQRGRLL